MTGPATADGRANGGQRVVFVTGPSGAGRQTAVKALEDFGYEAIDNLPLSLLPRLLDGPQMDRPLALGIDVRNRDFSVHRLVDLAEQLTRDDRFNVDLLFLDCSPEVLVRRFSETRRPHPLTPEDTPGHGIDRELDLLSPLRHRATVLIDTSELSPNELRAELARWFQTGGDDGLSLSLQSFSYKRGVPRGVDIIFDTRFLRNPHWKPDLRALDGRSAPVQDYVAADPAFGPFRDRFLDLILSLLPSFLAEGKSNLAIAFGCTGGQHRSVAVTEFLAKSLEQAGWQVSKRHRELGRADPARADRGAANRDKA